MRDETTPERPPLDAETIAFAGRVFQAARSGDPELIAVLRAGLVPNLRNDKGDTLLMLASYHGRVDTVAALLEAGADPSIVNDRGQLALAAAAFKGDIAVVRLLLDHGAAVDATGPDGRTALMVAAMFNRTAILDVLLSHGADPALRDIAGNAALDAARAMGAKDTADRLATAPAAPGSSAYRQSPGDERTISGAPRPSD